MPFLRNFQAALESAGCTVGDLGIAERGRHMDAFLRDFEYSCQTLRRRATTAAILMFRGDKPTGFTKLKI